MTHKCMDRWTDPLRGKTETQLGPFSCGRPAGHKGVHAHSGHGAHALWSDGELLLALQAVGPPRVAEAVLYPELGAGRG